MTRVFRCVNGDCRQIAKRYSYGLWPNRQLTYLCDACQQHLSEIGMALVLEHRDDPNRQDRNRAPWLGKARETTDYAA